MDTQLIGLFGKDEDTDKIMYMPSVEYLQAGKFKLHKDSSIMGSGSETAGDVAAPLMEQYIGRYNQKLIDTPKTAFT